MSTRRRNKSSKVPNVKLRPADAQAVATSKARLAHNAISTSWAQDSDDGELEGDSMTLDPCPRPLKGLIICATGLSDKTSLFKNAVELGALALHDLTDRVTHLIAEEDGSAKYKCALERKIPIMHPSWIRECYQTWLRGDDVDLPASIKAHRLPIFSGVTLCVTGIEDVSLRTKINKLVTSQGGAYAKALERPVKVTHLICSGDEETEKRRYADKFNSTGEAKIHVIWEEWFWDCLEYGGRFSEATYVVSNPRPERRAATDIALANDLPQPSTAPVSSSIPAASGKRASTRPGTPAGSLPPGVEEEDELVSVRRVPAETLQVWESVLRPRGFVLAEGRLQRSPSKSQSQPPTSPRSAGTLPARAMTLQNLTGARMSALQGLSRVKSFAPMSKDISTPKQLFRKQASKPSDDSSSFFGGIRAREEAENNGVGPTGQHAEVNMVPNEPQVPAIQGAVPQRSSPKTANAEAGPSNPRTAFAGVRFHLLGEARCDNVKKGIEDAGGWVHDQITDADFIIIRLVSGSGMFRAEANAERRLKYRTECWLERCILEERICEAEDHPAFVPIPVSVPLNEAHQVTLSMSGLDQSELCWVRRLAKVLGLTISPSFSRRSTHLLCPSGAGAKFDKAVEWGTPVVGYDWLSEMAQTGLIPPSNMFLIGAGGVRLPPDVMPDFTPSTPSLSMKGKGRDSLTPAGGIQDITNGLRSLSSSREGTMSHMNNLSQLVIEEPQQHTHEDYWMPNGLLSMPKPMSPASSPTHSPRPITAPSTPPPPSSSNAPSPNAEYDERERTVSPSPAKTVSGMVKVTSGRNLADMLVLGKRTSENDEEPSFRAEKRSRPLTRTPSGISDGDPVKKLSPPSFAPYEGLHSSIVAKYVADAGHITHEDPLQRLEQAQLLTRLGKSMSGKKTLESAPIGNGKQRIAKRASRQPGF